MTANQIDPEGRCSKATRALQECLIAEANRLADSTDYEPALALMFRAYALRPGVTPVLHSIGRLYEAMGDSESATACQRGVIPESAETRYFNARTGSSHFTSARKASNCQHIKTHRAENINLQAPSSNGQPATRPEFRARQTESRGSFVSIIDHGGFWFDGFNTAVFDKQQTVLKEHVKGNAFLVADTARQRPEHAVDGTVCFLDARSSSIYYHWMMDVLPKLAVLSAAGIDLETIDYFVVRCDSGFQKGTLKHLGIPDEKLMAPWNEGVTRCRKLIVPYLKNDRGDRFYNGLGLGMARWVPSWLKSVFVDTALPQGEKLYISRASRGTRSPLLEEKLISELQRRGITSVTLESMTVTEQARLLSRASLVIAPHGAGLSNIVFCDPGTIVVELFDQYVVPCYWALSELADLDYHAYFASETSPRQASLANSSRQASSLAERRDQNMNLDIDELLRYLDELMHSCAKAS